MQERPRSSQPQTPDSQAAASAQPSGFSSASQGPSRGQAGWALTGTVTYRGAAADPRTFLPVFRVWASHLWTPTAGLRWPPAPVHRSRWLHCWVWGAGKTQAEVGRAWAKQGFRSRCLTMRSSCQGKERPWPCGAAAGAPGVADRRTRADLLLPLTPQTGGARGPLPWWHLPRSALLVPFASCGVGGGRLTAPGAPVALSGRGPAGAGVESCPAVCTSRLCRCGSTPPPRCASRWAWGSGCSSPSPATTSSPTIATGES